MKALSITTALLAAIFLAGLAITFAEAGQGNGPGNPDCPNFVDADGNGINDNCTGDGTRPQDGTGERRGTRGGRKGNGGRGSNPDCPNFVDEDGDGINDSCPNGGIRPQDGTGARKRAKRGTRGGNGNGTGRKTRRGGRN